MKMETGKIILLVLIFSHVVASLAINWQAFSTAAPVGLKAVLNGSASAKLEEKYRDQLFFKKAAVSTFGTLRYAAFGEGRKGVIVGDNGWLFSTEELERPVNLENLVRSHIAEISDTQRILKESGTDLVVALIPEKADIYAKNLKSKIDTGNTNLNYLVVRQQLLAQNVSVPDLRDVLMTAKDHVQVFLKTDTHWTPEGALAAATALGVSIEKLSLGAEKKYRSEQTGALAVVGDLTTYLSLGPWQGVAGYAAETIKQFSITEETSVEGAGDIFESAAIPVALVGTSYSANENWGFAADLRMRLNSDVLNVAEVGKGPFVPMSTYLQSASFKEGPPKLVIWEIPLRYFAISPQSPDPVKNAAMLSATAGK